MDRLYIIRHPLRHITTKYMDLETKILAVCSGLIDKIELNKAEVREYLVSTLRIKQNTEYRIGILEGKWQLYHKNINI